MSRSNNDCCIICLDEEHSENENNVESEGHILPINNINELEKKCKCEYNVHKRCIKDWLNNKPVCVLCNSPLYYIESNLHRSIPEGIVILCNNSETQRDDSMFAIYSDEHENEHEHEHENEDEDENYIYVTRPISSLTWCIMVLCSIIILYIIIYNTV